MIRDQVLHVRVSDDEVAVLDELRGRQPRSAFLRALIKAAGPSGTSNVDRSAFRNVATREESLAMLTEMARDGKVAAAIALARELRSERESDEVPEWLK